MKQLKLKTFLIIYFFILILLGSSLGYAENYYIKLTGNDTNTGLGVTDELAWQTIPKANSTLIAGDTVHILAGTYTTGEGNCIIRPYNSGTSGNPITYTNYQTDTVILRNTTNTGATYGFLFVEDYITVDGININNVSQADSDMDFFAYLYANHNHIIIQNCTLEYANSSASPSEYGIFMENGCTYCEFKNNTIRYVGITGSDVGDGIKFQESGTTCTSQYNLIEGNTVEYCGHSCLILQGLNNVIKDNMFYSPWEKCIDIIGNNDSGAVPQYNLVTGNKFYDAGSGEAGGANTYLYSGIQNMGLYNIIRQNRIYGCYGVGIACFGQTTRPSTYNHIYNNVLYDNGKEDGDAEHGTGLLFQEYTGDGTAINNVIKNNINYNNQDAGVSYLNCTADQQTFANNHWDADGDPKFKNAANDDFDIYSTSPCIDAGGWLTTITSVTGSGTSFVVADALYFCDGHNIVTGDEIVTERGYLGTITDINYSTNTITVSSSVSWIQGIGVGLKYDCRNKLIHGKPDAGAYEHWKGIIIGMLKWIK